MVGADDGVLVGDAVGESVGISIGNSVGAGGIGVGDKVGACNVVGARNFEGDGVGHWVANDKSVVNVKVRTRHEGIRSF
jgi:hypothetical protein